MSFGQFTGFEIVLLVQHELLLFAAVFFALGALDELVVDFLWLVLKVGGRTRTLRVEEAKLPGTLSGTAAIFIPAWQEAAVIGPMLMHARSAWPQSQIVFYVGCYRNDDGTAAAVHAAAQGDPRVRIVFNDELGPTTKPACLNTLYAALCVDEAHSGIAARMVVLHDAEDMVDPAALALLDKAIARFDFVQLPVLALPYPGKPWISGHYSDEFAEAHCRTMVVRSALGTALPGAGVGCAISRPMMARLAQQSSDGHPFARIALTEDYELGLRVAALGGKAKFLRLRTRDGRLVATRAFFPDRIDAVVRQKTRWLHGIALQGWDRIGWWGSPLQRWMKLRDRRGPFAAILLAIAYALFVVTAVQWTGDKLGLIEMQPLSPLLQALLTFNLLSLVWRLALRAAFTANEFGWHEGLRALPRLLVSNVIAIMAGRRAIVAYIASLRGAPVIWDKTEHRYHPAAIAGQASITS